MGPNREYIFSLGEIGPVVDKVLRGFAKMPAGVADKIYFWKGKFPVNMQDALAFQSMVVGTWRSVFLLCFLPKCE